MNVGIITTTNQKGQIVIPQKIRKQLGIYPNSVLNLIPTGDGIYLYPIEGVITKAEKESSYFELLKKTKGTWDEEKWSLLKKNRKQTELKASSARKKPW